MRADHSAILLSPSPPTTPTPVLCKRSHFWPWALYWNLARNTKWKKILRAEIRILGQLSVFFFGGGVICVLSLFSPVNWERYTLNRNFRHFSWVIIIKFYYFRLHHIRHHFRRIGASNWLIQGQIGASNWLIQEQNWFNPCSVFDSAHLLTLSPMAGFLDPYFKLLREGVKQKNRFFYGCIRNKKFCKVKNFQVWVA